MEHAQVDPVILAKEKQNVCCTQRKNKRKRQTEAHAMSRQPRAEIQSQLVRLVEKYQQYALILGFMDGTQLEITPVPSRGRTAWRLSWTAPGRARQTLTDCDSIACVHRYVRDIASTRRLHHIVLGTAAYGAGQLPELLGIAQHVDGVWPRGAEARRRRRRSFRTDPF